MSTLPNWKTVNPAIRDELLKRYLAEGLSASKISEKFEDCTRSAVIGRSHRLQLRKSTLDAKPTSVSKASSKPTSQRAVRKTRRSLEPTPMRGSNNPHHLDFKARAEQRAVSPGLAEHLIAGEAKRPIEIQAPTSLNLSMAELSNSTCRWPQGDPQKPTFGFCGIHTSRPPYCPYHSRLAFMPLSERQRKGLKTTERIR